MPIIEPNQNTGGGSGSQPVVAGTFSLTAAQVKASTLTPITIAAAPGPNKLIVPISYVFALTFVGIAYGRSGVEAIYGSSANLSTVFVGLDATQSNAGWVQGVTELWFRNDVVNQPLKLRAALGGSIASSHLGFGGLGYVVNDTGTVDDGSTLATYKILTVDGGGGVLTYALTSAGSDYVAGVLETTTVGGAQPGIGTQFEINVDSVDASGAVGDGTLKGAVYYVVVDV